VNQEFLARMNASGKIHLTPAKVKGKYIIRFVANQESCNEAQIQGAWDLIKKFADETIKDVGYRKKPRPEIKKFDLKRAQRFSFTRNVSQEIFERQSSMYAFTFSFINCSLFNEIYVYLIH
jgi:tyrosine decarboxylase